MEEKTEEKVEQKALIPEVVNLDLKTKKKHMPLGQYLVTGGPGRPKGMRNKFTQVKADILSTWKSEKGKEKFKALLNGSSSDYKKALDVIVAIMPKESVIDMDVSSEEKIVFVFQKDQQ